MKEARISIVAVLVGAAAIVLLSAAVVVALNHNGTLPAATASGTPAADTVITSPSLPVHDVAPLILRGESASHRSARGLGTRRVPVSPVSGPALPGDTGRS